MAQRILLTGAQGFLGRYLVADWLAADAEVEILGIGRSPRSSIAFTHPVTWAGRRIPAPVPPALHGAFDDERYRYRRADLADTSALTETIREFRPHVVVHLVAALRGDPPERLFATNVVGTHALLEAIAGAGTDPPRIVLGSSGGVYGDPATAGLPIRENAFAAPVELYSVSKRASEDTARVLAARDGLPLVIARIFNPLGPGQDERHVCGSLAAQLAAVRKGLRPATVQVGTLSTTRDFLDVRDIARALRLLARPTTPEGIYNVASGRETAVGEVLETLLDHAGLAGRVRVDPLPPRPADIPRHFADVERIARLGFRPSYDLAESLEDLLSYYEDVVASAEAETPVAAPTPTCGRRAVLSVEADRRHRYEVTVEPGLLRSLPATLAARHPGAPMVVLTDTGVEPLYARDFVAGLREAGVRCEAIVLPAGETSKALDPFRDVLERMHAVGFDRRALLVNLGGGMVTDVGGFAASSYLRGVAYVNVPTTLLAQHDSAIGGKVAVNAPWAKNFIGAFHHPAGVYCDPAVLATLSDRDLSAGVAEAIKVAITGDGRLFEYLEGHVRAARHERDAEVLAEIVGRSARRKIALLAPDPYEIDLRRALNLGHTFGHPLEVELEYKGLLHGEAVGFGIAVATAIAEGRGACAEDAAERIYALLDVYGLPPRVERARLETALERVAEIRLVRANRLHFVLPTGVDSVRIVDEVGDEEFLGAFDRMAAHPVLGAAILP